MGITTAGVLGLVLVAVLARAYRVGQRIDWIKVMVPVAILLVALDAWYVLEMRRIRDIAISPVNAGADVLGQKPLPEESGDETVPQ